MSDPIVGKMFRLNICKIYTRCVVHKVIDPEFRVAHLRSSMKHKAMYANLYILIHSSHHNSIIFLYKRYNGVTPQRGAGNKEAVYLNVGNIQIYFA